MFSQIVVIFFIAILKEVKHGVMLDFLTFGFFINDTVLAV